MATFLDLGEWSWPDSFEGQPLAALPGKSLRPIFEDKTRKPHEALYLNLLDHRAVVSGEWKLASDWGRPRELFNLGRDRAETRDLARAEPD